VYFTIRNILLKSGTFLLGHPIYIYIYIYICLPGVVLNEAQGLYNWIFQCGGCMTFSDKCVISTTTKCGADILGEPVVSIIFFFHPENGSRRLLRDVGTYVPNYMPSHPKRL